MDRDVTNAVDGIVKSVTTMPNGKSVVVIVHENGVTSTFNNLTKYFVAAGDEVTDGQIIGEC